MHVTVGVIASRGSKILVLPNKYGGVKRIVTGFVDYGEEPERAALRELSEETGLNGEIDSLLGVYNVGKKVRNVLIVYVVKKIWRPDTQVRRKDYEWQDLPVLLNQEKDPGFKKIYLDFAQYAKILSG